jgi:DNA-binding winged helix-turn-helix (wHTH) protein/tetratricopeptide (TPR) repeat protein
MLVVGLAFLAGIRARNGEETTTLRDRHFEFGPFCLYPTEQLLLRDGKPQAVAPKAFEILVALVAKHGRLVTREALMQTVWPDSFVEETNLTVNISQLRKTLGEMPDGSPWIATVPKRGYRFDGEVVAHMVEAPTGEFPSPAELSAARLVQNGPEVSGHEVSGHEPHAGEAEPRHELDTGLAAVHTATEMNAGEAKQRMTAVSPAAQAEPNPPGRPEQKPVSVASGFSDVVRSSPPVAPLAAAEATVSRSRQTLWISIAAVLAVLILILWGASRLLQPSATGKAPLSAASGSLHAPGTPAYELYTQGRNSWNQRTVASEQKSIEYFRQATELDPGYAAAWSGLADAWILAGSYGNSFLAPSVAMPKAKEAAEKALALDDSSPDAHTSLAYIHLMWDWDFPGAEREFRRALEINPNYVNAHHWYSHELMALGRVGESHEQSEAALGLEPTDVVINEHMAWHHLMAREYDRSIPQANKAIEIDPNFVQAHRVLAQDLLYTGHGREACAEFDKGVQLSHGDPVARAYLARCYAFTHREAEARGILADLERDSTVRYISAAEIAAVYAALNEPQKAFAWLDKACAEHAGSLVYLNADRVWDGLRANPKFLALLQRVHLPAMADEVAGQ